MNIRVIADAVPIHGETIERALRDYTDSSNKPDWVIYVYVRPSIKRELKYWEKKGVRTCGYWIGNDARFAFRNMIFNGSGPKFDVNLCVHERLVPELQQVGVKARVVPFLTRTVLLATPQPESPLVSVYMPSVNGKYRFKQMLDVAQRCPDLPFIFYGSALSDLPANCKSLGRLTPDECTDVIKSSSCVLRITDHDGFPQNIIEAKMMGRQVVANYRYPGCLVSGTTDGIVDLLLDPKTHQPDETENPEWYRQNCSPEAFARAVMLELGTNGKA